MPPLGSGAGTASGVSARCRGSCATLWPCTGPVQDGEVITEIFFVAVIVVSFAQIETGQNS